jgi:uncharacterized membrane protein YgaE (UPF0421/DUF939 family)
VPDAPPARWRSWLSGLDQLLPPHLQLTLKAALAAGVSWQLAQQLPSSVNQYAYYAPLGAILAIFPTVVSSLKAALQTVLGILLGAGIATAVDTFFPTSAWTVAAVAGGGILVGALRWLGDQRAWVPITALFVFVIGGAASPSYLVGYVVLTLMGAAIGTLVNLLIFPPLHLRESRRALEALREVVVAQLEDLADGLEVNERPDPATWERRTRAISPAVSTMREAVADMARSLRVNPRAARYRRATSTLEREGRALYRIALLVEEMVDLLTEVEQQDMPASAVQPADQVGLRPGVAGHRLAGREPPRRRSRGPGGQGCPRRRGRGGGVPRRGPQGGRLRPVRGRQRRHAAAALPDRPAGRAEPQPTSVVPSLSKQVV